MEKKSIGTNLLKIALPLLLGGAILYWMYRDFDFRTVGHVMLHNMNWTWMLLSFPFGILAQMIRGWRWKQTLEPMFRGAEEESRYEEEESRYEVRGTRYENTSAAASSGEGNLVPRTSYLVPRKNTPEKNTSAAASSGEGNLVPRTSHLVPRKNTPRKNTPRTSTCVNAVFLSYAVSLIIPRIGEFTRCGVLKRWEDISFSKALGTVVTERAVDTIVVMLYSGLILLIEMSVFGSFFRKTGTSIDRILSSFSLTGYLVTAVCGVAALILLHLLLKNLSIYNKVKTTLSGIWEGVLSLRGVKDLPLYLLFSVGIWVCYFLHYYLTFFCFDFTADLGIGCALVSFVVANFAVIVPTPNGAGPWHFAIKTMLILYGVQDEQALFFVLIVHTVQTLLVVALGIYAWGALLFSRRNLEERFRGERREERGERLLQNQREERDYSRIRERREERD